METVVNTISDIIYQLNPANVNWGSFGEIALYLIYVVLTLVGVGLIIYSILNFKKFINFLKSTYSELKKVTWLSKKNTYRFTFMTIVVLIVSTLFLILTDQTFLFLRGMLISSGA